MLKNLIARMGVGARDVIRQKGTSYDDLGLAGPNLTDDDLIDAMLAHPILIERPIVVTPRGVRLCRPAATVLDLLPPQQAPISTEDGLTVIDEGGRRVSVA